MAWTRTRTRRIAKSLIAVGGFCALLLVLSGLFNYGTLLSGTSCVACSKGLIGFGWTETYNHASDSLFVWCGPAFACQTRDQLEWWKFDCSIGAQGLIAFPLWVPALLAFSCAALLLHRTRHIPGHCRHCRYDLAGLPPESPCPECGRASTEKGA